MRELDQLQATTRGVNFNIGLGRILKHKLVHLNSHRATRLNRSTRTRGSSLDF